MGILLNPQQLKNPLFGRTVRSAVEKYDPYFVKAENYRLKLAETLDRSRHTVISNEILGAFIALVPHMLISTFKAFTKTQGPTLKKFIMDGIYPAIVGALVGGVLSTIKFFGTTKSQVQTINLQNRLSENYQEQFLKAHPNFYLKENISV